MLQFVTQTLRTYIGPILLNEIQTVCPLCLAVNYPPAWWDIGEHRPQTVLFFGIDQYNETTGLIIKRISPHN